MPQRPGKNALRLLFDEHMSVTVARALSELGKATTYVGAQRQPKKGTDDSVVAAEAKKQRRVVVTFNFDMVLSAIEVGTRFIWFDQRGRSPTRMETALIFLRQWDEWERCMADQRVPCLKVGREAVEVLDLESAKRRAERRFRESSQGDRRHQKLKALKAQGVLLLEFSDDE